ncbi:MAG: sulfite exporter TauE/SafE family protein [Candidatus Lokiarchaeota archaeon]|nr:sulfite exporter TauE/SafE family protein [Candidatus Lokiarchaeota archaeon]
MLDWWLLIVLGVVLGFLVGIYASLSGTGGGSLYGPIFEAMLFLDVHMAIGTSLFVVFINSISTSHAYIRQKRIDYRLSLYLILFSTPFAIVGSIMTEVITTGFVEGKTVMKLVFYAFVLFVGCYMIAKKNDKPSTIPANACNDRWYLNQCLVDCDGTEFKYEFSFKQVIPWAMLAGFLSGFLGIGGGMIMVPAFTIICGMPTHVVVATSGFMLLFNSLVGSITKIAVQNVDIVVGLIFAAGSIFGAQLGAKIAKGTKNNTLKNIVSAFLVMLAVYKLVDIIFF